MSDSVAPAVPIINVSGSKADAPQAVQAPPVPEVKVPETKPDDKFASKFAALTRKERELRDREGKSKTEVEAAKKQVEEYRNKYGQYESLEESIKNDKRQALKWITDKGVTPEELSDMLLEELDPNPERKLAKTTSDIEKRLMERIAALEGKLTDKEKADLQAQKDAEQANFDKTVNQVKSELKEFIDASDDYELIKLSGEYETVFDVMQEHYNDQISKGVTPDKIKLLSYEEAAKWTESYLDQDANRKYEAKRAKQAAKTPEPVSKKTTSPTLSNTLSTEVPTSAENKPKSRDESLARAARLLRYVEE